MNVENTFTYDFFEYTIVLPRYRLASTLSAVVMVSAFLELLVISRQWDSSFRWDGEAFSQAGTLFSNGYRYMNWSIDVPVLLLQLLIVLGVTGAAFRRGWIAFTVAGLAMIYTGYVGQFYEVERSAPFWIWGSISTVFFLVILVLVYRTIYGNVGRLPEEVRPLVRSVWWLLLASWMLYPGAYLMPALWDSADGVVARQITYTVADITSKIIYGILLAVIGRKVSKHEGHEDAVASDVTMPRGGITEVAPPGRAA